MQARTLPYSRGRAWLLGGVALWRKSPALITFYAFAYLLVLLLLSLMPFVGQIATALLMPVLSLGVLNGCRAVDEGRRAGPELLFSGFRQHPRALITVGGLYFAASLATLGLTMLLDGGLLFDIMQGKTALDESAADDGRLNLALIVALLLSTPVLMAYWFAPLLAGWFGQPAGKALFFSLVVCWRNWKPFLGYGINLLVFGLALPGLVISVLSLVSPALGGLVSIALPMLLIPIVCASFYVNAREIFLAPEISTDDEA